MNSVLTKTVKGKAIKAAQCLASMCPSLLQGKSMVGTVDMCSTFPLVPAEEWEKYIILPAQQPPPTTTAGRVEWWKNRLGDFPVLGPLAIAYVQFPRSAARSERTFSLVGHIQTEDRLNMSNPTMQNLAFLYINKQLFSVL